MIDRDRLRLEMQKQQMSQAELARAAGVSAASIQQILNGSVKSPRSIRDLAQALRVSVDWLEGISDDPQRRYLEDVENDDLTPVAFQYFVRAARSSPIHDVVSTVVIFSKSWIERVAGTSKYDDIVVFRIAETDMSPTLSPGDEVILASHEFDNHPDSIWFFEAGGKTFIRRVRRIGENRVAVSADNPAFATFELEEDSLTFMGRLVWHGRSLGA